MAHPRRESAPVLAYPVEPGYKNQQQDYTLKRERGTMTDDERTIQDDRYDDYVHEYVDGDGRVLWCVGKWQQDAGQFQRPLDSEERELTGCDTEFGPLSYMPRYVHREDAECRASQLWNIR